jgi:hypothetical protein
MKQAFLTVTAATLFCLAGCATDPGDPPTSETSAAATQCWGQPAGVHDGACGSVLYTIPPGGTVLVFGTPFQSSCDGNFWVRAAAPAGVTGDIRWDALCH